MTPDQRAELRNCEGDTNPSFWMPWDKTGQVNRCPVVWFSPDVWQCVEWWSDWRRFKSLPFPGNINAQPFVVYQAITTCEIEMSDIQAEAPDNG